MVDWSYLNRATCGGHMCYHMWEVIILIALVMALLCYIVVELRRATCRMEGTSCSRLCFMVGAVFAAGGMSASRAHTRVQVFAQIICASFIYLGSAIAILAGISVGRQRNDTANTFGLESINVAEAVADLVLCCVDVNLICFWVHAFYYVRLRRMKHIKTAIVLVLAIAYAVAIAWGVVITTRTNDKTLIQRPSDIVVSATSLLAALAHFSFACFLLWKLRRVFDTLGRTMPPRVLIVCAFEGILRLLRAAILITWQAWPDMHSLDQMPSLAYMGVLMWLPCCLLVYAFSSRTLPQSPLYFAVLPFVSGEQSGEVNYGSMPSGAGSVNDDSDSGISVPVAVGRKQPTKSPKAASDSLLDPPAWALQLVQGESFTSPPPPAVWGISA
eukprot:NODE_1132_length_1452_cov_37.106415_g1121_i0.p1 GENE.NODE_1132_length_1452_cov_37.106415_g1121_i0~~NODE_1132_length_1452_cov_37.106415_g1121_i0.p1  ORF type:complete len:386 (+),score=51.09 NODE_1132_length_1452_cov_37.106415_g1121_i0:178-1335(+)